jgi:hypothetical protein
MLNLLLQPRLVSANSKHRGEGAAGLRDVLVEAAVLLSLTEEKFRLLQTLYDMHTKFHEG